LLQLFLRFAAGVLVSALTVLAVRQGKPPDEASFSAFRPSHTRASSR